MFKEGKWEKYYTKKWSIIVEEDRSIAHAWITYIVIVFVLYCILGCTCTLKSGAVYAHTVNPTKENSMDNKCFKVTLFVGSYINFDSSNRTIDILLVS